MNLKKSYIEIINENSEYNFNKELLQIIKTITTNSELVAKAGPTGKFHLYSMSVQRFVSDPAHDQYHLEIEFCMAQHPSRICLRYHESPLEDCQFLNLYQFQNIDKNPLCGRYCQHAKCYPW